MWYGTQACALASRVAVARLVSGACQQGCAVADHANFLSSVVRRFQSTHESARGTERRHARAEGAGGHPCCLDILRSIFMPEVGTTVYE